MSELHLVDGTGYQAAASPGGLADHLAERGVGLVVDVRLSTFSKRPGFDAAGLTSALDAEGIAYRHEAALGNPADNRAGFAQTGPDREAAHERYRQCLTEQPARDALNRIWLDAHRYRLTLLCREGPEHTCHRHLILQHLATHLQVALAPAPVEQPSLFHL